MTTINQIMGDFANTFKGSIQPQINQITNLELTRYINTGDRVKDNALIIIVNGFISVLISIIFYYLNQFYIMLKRKFLSKNNYLIDYDVVMKDMTYDKLQEQYLFKYGLRESGTAVNDITASILLDYIKNNNILSKIGLNMKKSINLRQKMSFRNSKQDITNQVLESYKNENMLDKDYGDSAYFMPVYNYINNNREEEYIYLRISTLYSKSFEELNNFVYILLNYANKNNTLNQTAPKLRYNQPLRIFESSANEDNSCMHTHQIGDINSDITFNSIYFDDKPELLKWIDKFETKTMYPKRLSLTNKLGILLYGPPGTGKTGCIFALANKLKRDILIIKTLSLTGKLQTSLLKLIGDFKSNSIIVFDEFDYVLSDKNMDKDYDNNDNQHYIELLHSADTQEKKQEILKVMRETKKIKNEGIVDTRFILTLLDGLGNDNDRIIIATTNNPDKINPIFLRPGRFDLVMKLSFCSFDMFKEIVLTKFEELNDEYFETNKQRIQNVLKLNITPLILINKLVTLNSIESLLNSLSKLPKSTYNLEPQKPNL